MVMFSFLFIILSTAAILFVLFFVAGIISLKNQLRSDSLSVFECGFMSSYASRMPFSLHFFLVSVIFLVFDVELIILYPFLLTQEWSSLTYQIMGITFFFIALTATFLYEWAAKNLEWVM